MKVALFGGASCTVPVTPVSKVLELKHSVAAELGIPAEEQEWTTEGHDSVLRDSMSTGECNLGTGGLVTCTRTKKFLDPASLLDIHHVFDHIDTGDSTAVFIFPEDQVPTQFTHPRGPQNVASSKDRVAVNRSEKKAHWFDCGQYKCLRVFIDERPSCKRIGFSVVPLV